MKFICFILSLIIFSQSIGIQLSDALNLGELVEHAQFHSEKYGDDFFTFLSKHYGNEKGQHKHQNENDGDHGKLPFQKTACQFTTLSILPSSIYNVKKTEALTPSKHKTLTSEGDYKHLFSLSVFQPPQA